MAFMIFIFHVHFGSFQIILDILGLRFGSFSLFFFFCPERRVSFAERERCGGGTSIADGRGPGPATTGALDDAFWWGIYWIYDPIDVLCTHTHIYIYNIHIKIGQNNQFMIGITISWG